MNTEQQGWSPRQTIAILAIGLAYCAALVLKVGPLNGIPEMSNWEWPWRSFGNLRTAALLFAPFPFIAWVAWKAEEKFTRAQVTALLGLLVAANFGLQLLEVLVDRRGYGYFLQIVTSPKATSYYTDALAIQNLAQWLGSFHLQQLHNHAATHPPAPILFYWVFIQIFGAKQAALLGACAVGFTGALGVAVAYHFAGLWRREQRTQLIAAALYALMPALVVFFPEFDQFYPIFTMLMVMFWVRALEGSAKDAVYLGLTLFVSSYFAYNLLTVGVFLVFYGIYWLWRGGGMGQLVVRAAVAIGLWVAIYGLLWVSVGYNPIASLKSALASQALFASYLKRSYIRCAIYDPFDFFLGAGYLTVASVFLYLGRHWREFSLKRTDLALTAIGLLTILTIDFTGLLRAETMRVWLFYQPLITIPAALEIARVNRNARVALFGVQWLIVVAIKANMGFIRP